MRAKDLSLFKSYSNKLAKFTDSYINFSVSWKSNDYKKYHLQHAGYWKSITHSMALDKWQNIISEKEHDVKNARSDLKKLPQASVL